MEHCQQQQTSDQVGKGDGKNKLKGVDKKAEAKPSTMKKKPKSLPDPSEYKRDGVVY